MKSIAACLLALTLSGCITTQFDNIVSCAKAGDVALYSSMYGAIGVTSKVRDADAKAICK